MKKKMIVLIAFIYIASMLFCGDGVGKKLVEEKFPHLTYSDKECEDSKKKELRIGEDEVSGTICCRIPTNWHLLMKLKKTVS